LSAGGDPIATLRPIVLIAALLALSGAADLPKQGPLPVEKPGSETGDLKKDKPETPSATEGKATDDAARKAADDAAQKAADEAARKVADEAARKAAAEAEKAKARPKESPADEAACRTELKAIGALYEEAGEVDDGKACGIDKPVLLKGLPGAVAIEPAATVRCDTALQLARWMEGSVKPSLEAAMPGETITGLSQASAYVCRNRNGASEGRISEHAFGNAVDIAGFTLKSGKTITIRPADKEPTMEGAFQRAITEAACLYFTTVLDPGSDAAHQNHLHLDVKERRGGYRYCW
jgi:hypothetical protein